jgi:hypothetical protein
LWTDGYLAYVNSDLVKPYTQIRTQFNICKKVWGMWFFIPSNYTFKQNFFYQINYTSGTTYWEPDDLNYGYDSQVNLFDYVFGDFPVNPNEANNFTHSFESRGGYLSSPQFNGANVWY